LFVSVQSYCHISSIRAESLILPTSLVGMMNDTFYRFIIDEYGDDIVSPLKKQLKENKNPPLGKCFSVETNKRGSISNLYFMLLLFKPNGSSSIYAIREGLKSSLNKALSDGVSSVAISGLCSNPLGVDTMSIAGIVFEETNKFKDNLDIYIVESDRVFVKEYYRLQDWLLNKESRDGSIR